MHLYIGFDSSNYGQQLAYEVCKRSVRKYNQEISITPLVLQDLQEQGIFTREVDPLASTEFTYTRFLVPYLSNYQGLAIFCDSDFLWRCNINEVFNFIDDTEALSCVQHDYTPSSSLKMDGKVQTVYPRKNWSSLMVFNCSHQDCHRLTLENVNHQTPKYLHRFEWCDDQNLGSVPLSYNYLIGYYNSGDLKALHFTDGGPWHKDHRHVDYADEWLSFLTSEEKLKLDQELNEK